MIKIKVGVIGAGRWGQKHIEEYLNIKGVDLSWVCDISEENLKSCKEKFKIKNTSKDYFDVLDSDAEAISVCTSNETHYKICKDGLNAGKNVIVEKPLTVNFREAYELVDIAKNQKKILAVGHLFRYNNAINHVKKLINENYFGDLFYLRLQWTIQWLIEIYPDKKLDIIFDMMPHMYDIMNYLTGLWPKSITCLGKAFMKKEFEDTAYIICEFPKNIMTHTEISWTLPEKVRQVDIIGRKATAKINVLPQNIEIFEKSNEGKKVSIKPNNTLNDELKSFIDAIKTGETLVNDGLVGAKTVELTLKTRESLQKNKTIII